ncbi:NucA/NucB deoxyribonuclease domain-containing protein, partial [Streptomyces decoyicus]
MASATLALAGALLAPASATATVPRTGAETTQDVGPAGEIPQPQTAGPVELDTKQNCDTLQEQLDGYAAQGIETVTCLDQLASSPTGGQAAAPLKATDAPEEPAGAPLSAAPKCSVAMGQWYFTRFDACGSLQLTYDVFDTRTKKKIGGATFTAKQEIILQAKSGAWKTDDSLKLDSAWGAAKGLRAAWKTECLSGSACGASSGWSGAQAIGVGKTLYGGTSHTWKAGQSIEGFQTKTTVTITGVGQILLYPASFQPPGKMTIRCDKIASGSSTGCAFPSFTPTLMLPLENRGQVNVAWSMQYLTDHWGWEGKGSPLTREMDEAVIKANRGKVCDSAWQRDSTVPDDSCDEFPFAATNQSGAQLNLSGKDCAQIRPDTPSGGRWTVSYINDTSGRRCTIGHVPNKENGSVGGSMSRFYQDQRVLDDEKFWLAVGRYHPLS